MTEKDYNPNQKEKKSMKKQKVVAKANPESEASLQKNKVLKETKKAEESAKKEKTEIQNIKESENKKEISEKEKTSEKKEVKKEIPKIKRTEVSAKGINLPISTKDAKFVCKFILRKNLGDAIRDLQKVVVGKKAVPMRGEIPHRKGKGIDSGRFPKKAAENFIIVLRSLAANANQSNIDEPVIIKAGANLASRPYGRFGRTQKKRTHIEVIVKEKSELKKKKNNEKPLVSQAIKQAHNNASQKSV